MICLERTDEFERTRQTSQDLGPKMPPIKSVLSSVTQQLDATFWRKALGSMTQSRKERIRVRAFCYLRPSRHRCCALKATGRAGRASPDDMWPELLSWLPSVHGMSAGRGTGRKWDGPKVGREERILKRTAGATEVPVHGGSNRTRQDHPVRFPTSAVSTGSVMYPVEIVGHAPRYPYMYKSAKYRAAHLVL